MQTLRPPQVPKYLRTSSFYLGLNVADDDEFSIPSNHMKSNTKVNTLTDMTNLLNTIRFWGSDFFPQAMFNFAEHQTYSSIDAIVSSFRTELLFICTVCCIISEVPNSKACVRLEKAMETGDIDVVKYFHNDTVPFTTRAIALAAGKNALDCLQYAISWRTNANTQCNVVFAEAVRNGCMDSIIYLQQRGYSLQFNYYSSDTTNLAETAALSGQFEVLKYLYNQGYPIRSAAIAAADAGHLKTVRPCAVSIGLVYTVVRLFSDWHALTN